MWCSFLNGDAHLFLKIPIYPDQQNKLKMLPCLLFTFCYYVSIVHQKVFLTVLWISETNSGFGVMAVNKPYIRANRLIMTLYGLDLLTFILPTRRCICSDLNIYVYLQLLMAFKAPSVYCQHICSCNTCIFNCHSHMTQEGVI